MSNSEAIANKKVLCPVSTIHPETWLSHLEMHKCWQELGQSVSKKVQFVCLYWGKYQVVWQCISLLAIKLLLGFCDEV